MVFCCRVRFKLTGEEIYKIWDNILTLMNDLRYFPGVKDTREDNRFIALSEIRQLNQETGSRDEEKDTLAPDTLK